ncbi:MAG: PEP-CTERM sorting domain-containing protein [Phycisphaerae bacterium]|nr:PEP-CTERM sorting domain-containing protein [Phycisphaerae bacterium]
MMNWKKLTAIATALLIIAAVTTTAHAATWTVTQLTSNDYNDGNPHVSGSNVVWYGDNGNDSEIFFYDGTSTTQLTNNSCCEYTSDVSGSNAVWYGWDGNDYEIFLWDGTEIIQLTDNDYDDKDPQIDGDVIVWYGYDGGDNEIFMATPEPAALSLLAVGGLALLRRRRS